MNKYVSAFIGKVKGFLYRNQDYYIAEINPNLPWVFVSYISSIFYHQTNQYELNKHQNRAEALKIVSIFNQLGYNVYVVDWFSQRELPELNVKVIFGVEPNFVRACEKWPTAYKIYYATGAYFEHQNNQIKKMTDMVNSLMNSSISYKRMVMPHNSCQLADSIIQIGSQYTISTYPVDVQSKISIIHQSTLSTKTNPTIELSKTPKEFFYMASGGNLLKGLHLIVLFFREHPEYVVNVVGPIEPDYHEIVKPLLTPNIRFYGFLDISSKLMLDLMKRSDFMLYPSGSEGTPGAVLNSMKNGLIPIVTRWAAFDEIENYGFVLEDWSVDAIEEGILWSQSLSDELKLVLKNKNADYIKKTYTIEEFSREFYNITQSLLTSLND